MSGRLVVCATPIGNLGDVTLRVLDALREADTVAAEDTRVTRKLLARYEIATRMERCDEHTVERQAPALVERMAGGEVIALVSDAGTPGVSDPGAAAGRRLSRSRRRRRGAAGGERDPGRARRERATDPRLLLRGVPAAQGGGAHDALSACSPSSTPR